MNGQAVSGNDKFYQLIDAFAGSEVEVTLMRDGTEIKKKIQFIK